MDEDSNIKLRRYTFLLCSNLFFLCSNFGRHTNWYLYGLEKQLLNEIIKVRLRSNLIVININKMEK